MGKGAFGGVTIDRGLPAFDPQDAMPQTLTQSEASFVPGRHAVRVGQQALPGDLFLPPDPCGLVLFAHGSGSSRLSPRNRRVASRLNESGMATLLFDLLTNEEEEDRRNVFDIVLLAGRLAMAHKWIGRRCPNLAVGYFGASTGAAAALLAASYSGREIAAVVSRGGRPDLAADRLALVAAPTLLIVGGDDLDVLALNRMAFDALRCTKRLAVIPGAGHLFEEPGAMDAVVDLVAAWFRSNFAGEP